MNGQKWYHEWSKNTIEYITYKKFIFLSLNTHNNTKNNNINKAIFMIIHINIEK